MLTAVAANKAGPGMMYSFVIAGVVCALTALIYEGHLSPTAEQVATRADVGLRTVFRHFASRESLIASVWPRMQARVRSTGFPQTAEALIAHCRGALTGYKVPRFVEFRDELPKSNVGKILRRVLRDASPAA